MSKDEPPPYEYESNSSSSIINSKNSIKLFPLYNVTIGKTKEKELQNMEYEKKHQGESVYYAVNCVNFWVKNGIAHHMYLTKANSMPEKWFAYGFSWSSSYNQWLELLQNKGFNIIGIDFPKTVKYNGHDSLNARIKCDINIDEYKYLLDLNFNYGDGSKADHKNTLYSLSLSYE
ncbi:unnamed protein product [Cunninghamella echinulata]